MEIKTESTCKRCKYHFYNWCVGRACSGCEQAEKHPERDTDDPIVCKCLRIKEGKKCPFFVEAVDDEVKEQKND